MDIIIKINTDNAAFEEDKEEEVKRIIKKWLDDNMRFTGLYDANGNKVGTVTVKGE